MNTFTDAFVIVAESQCHDRQKRDEDDNRDRATKVKHDIDNTGKRPKENVAGPSNAFDEGIGFAVR